MIREQGVTFAVAIVKPHILDDSCEAHRPLSAFRPAFPGIPVVLMTQDHGGTPTYYGRRDVSEFLASVPCECIPWAEYSFG